MLPCNHQIWSLWSPLQERTTLVTIALAGMNVGTVVTMPLTGLLTKYGFDGGWASVFYCFGKFCNTCFHDELGNLFTEITMPPLKTSQVIRFITEKFLRNFFRTIYLPRRPVYCYLYYNVFRSNMQLQVDNLVYTLLITVWLNQCSF